MSGAGLNPFVSIVGVGGIIQFLLDPVDVPLRSRTALATALAAAVLFVGGFNTVAAIANHTVNVPPWIPRQQGIRQVVQAMTNTVTRADPPRRFAFASIYLGGLNQAVLFNTMFFDWHKAFDRDRAAVIGASRLAGVDLQSDFPTRLGWSAVAGASDEEKVATIVQLADENADFIIAPGPGTELMMSYYGNRFAAEIYRRLVESGQWEQIAGPITISPIETTIILRNRQRVTNRD
jgi:hypothetical protein